MSIKAKDMTMAERKERVAQLVNQFKENEAFYLSKNFVERLQGFWNRLNSNNDIHYAKNENKWVLFGWIFAT